MNPPTFVKIRVSFSKMTLCDLVLYPHDPDSVHVYVAKQWFGDDQIAQSATNKRVIKLDPMIKIWLVHLQSEPSFHNWWESCIYHHDMVQLRWDWELCDVHLQAYAHTHIMPLAPQVGRGKKTEIQDHESSSTQKLNSIKSPEANVIIQTWLVKFGDIKVNNRIVRNYTMQ